MDFKCRGLAMERQEAQEEGRFLLASTKPEFLCQGRRRSDERRGRGTSQVLPALATRINRQNSPHWASNWLKILLCKKSAPARSGKERGNGFMTSTWPSSWEKAHAEKKTDEFPRLSRALTRDGSMWAKKIPHCERRRFTWFECIRENFASSLNTLLSPSFPFDIVRLHRGDLTPKPDRRTRTQRIDYTSIFNSWRPEGSLPSNCIASTSGHGTGAI